MQQLMPSCVSANVLHTDYSPLVVDFWEVALAQTGDLDLAKLCANSSLHLALAFSNGVSIICDISTGVNGQTSPRVFVEHFSILSSPCHTQEYVQHKML